MNNISMRFISGLVKQVISLWVLIAFLAVQCVSPLQAQAAEFFPQPGTMVLTTSAYQPVLMKAVKVFPQNPFKFDFIIDRGSKEYSEQDLKSESEQLVKYFLTSLTIPEKDMWVNLSPYEQDRIIPEGFGSTEMGRTVLLQDYILKQLSASMIHPDEQSGQKFWEKVYEKTYQMFGETDIPLETFHKVWIVPKTSSVYENADTNTTFIVETDLDVMLEEDYVALDQSKIAQETYDANNDDTEANRLSSEVMREIVIPLIKDEVNNGEHFAPLRQIMHSLVLATWYKQALKKSILSQGYVDQQKIEGVETSDLNAKETIYNNYVEAFRKGVFDFIKEEYDPVSQSIIPKKYFSGGVTVLGMTENLAVLDKSDPRVVEMQDNLAMLSADQNKLYVVDGGAVTNQLDEPDNFLSDFSAREKAALIYAVNRFNDALASLKYAMQSDLNLLKERLQKAEHRGQPIFSPKGLVAINAINAETYRDFLNQVVNVLSDDENLGPRAKNAKLIAAAKERPVELLFMIPETVLPFIDVRGNDKIWEMAERTDPVRLEDLLQNYQDGFGVQIDTELTPHKFSVIGLPDIYRNEIVSRFSDISETRQALAEAQHAFVAADNEIKAAVENGETTFDEQFGDGVYAVDSPQLSGDILKDIEMNGIPRDIVLKTQDFVREEGIDVLYLFASNPESMKYYGQEGYLPKPVDVKFVTAKSGQPDAGLAVSPMHSRQTETWERRIREARLQENWKEMRRIIKERKKAKAIWRKYWDGENGEKLRKAGYRVNPETGVIERVDILRDGQERVTIGFFSDPDIQGAFKKNADGSVEPVVFGSGVNVVKGVDMDGLDMRNKLNRKFHAFINYIGHGSQYEYDLHHFVKGEVNVPDSNMIAIFGDGRQPEILTTYEQKRQSYENAGAEWIYAPESLSQRAKQEMDFIKVAATYVGARTFDKARGYGESVLKAVYGVDQRVRGSLQRVGNLVQLYAPDLAPTTGGRRVNFLQMAASWALILVMSNFLHVSQVSAQSNQVVNTGVSLIMTPGAVNTDQRSNAVEVLANPPEKVDSAMIGEAKDPLAMKNEAVVPGTVVDSYGGIDLEKVDVNVEKKGSGVITAFDDPVQLEKLRNSKGLNPVVYEVKPLTLPILHQVFGGLPQ